MPGINFPDGLELVYADGTKRQLDINNQAKHAAALRMMLPHMVAFLGGQEFEFALSYPFVVELTANFGASESMQIFKIENDNQLREHIKANLISACRHFGANVFGYNPDTIETDAGELI